MEFENNTELNDQQIVRLIKNIVVSSDTSSYIDNSMIKHKIYNSFNLFFLSRENKKINFSVGITSSKKGEGKTIIAANLAVSIALSSKRKTLLLDLNLANPKLFKIFGVPAYPGLTEALTENDIHIFQSSIENLHILTAGKKILLHEEIFKIKETQKIKSNVIEPSLGLEHLSAFRDILYSLEQHYEFIIADTPALQSNTVPPLFFNQFHGLIIVVRSEQTKKEDIDMVFQRVSERSVIGFVLNEF